MTRTLAARLSRALVRCYPRRWRQRYASELLEVLDQHQAGARTVLSLAGGAVSTHLDPAYRLEGLRAVRFRRLARMSAAVAGPIALIAVPFGLFVHAQAWKDSHWHIGSEGGVNAMAFSPVDQDVLVTATSQAMDGLDTLWDVARPSRPRQLASFEGGAPTVFAPNGALVATVAYSGQPALWNVADLRHPTRITTLRTGDRGMLWGEAFSPDGRVLAAAYTDRLFLWDVTSPARPRLLRTLAAPVDPPAPAACGQPCPAPDPFEQGDIAFSPDGRLLASAAGRDQVAVWNVSDPARATRIAVIPGAGVPGDSGFVEALAFSPRGNLLADVSYGGTVTMLSLARPAHPARVAIMQTVTARQIAASECLGGCAPRYTLQFAPDGQTLTAVSGLASPSMRAALTSAPSPAQGTRDYVFRWNVTNPQSVTRIAAFSRSAPTSASGDGSLPLIAADGRTLAAGAPFGSFGVTLWTLP
jgi:WD40 repeat protein